MIWLIWYKLIILSILLSFRFFWLNLLQFDQIIMHFQLLGKQLFEKISFVSRNHFLSWKVILQWFLELFKYMKKNNRKKEILSRSVHTIAKRDDKFIKSSIDILLNLNKVSITKTASIIVCSSPKHSIWIHCFLNLISLVGFWFCLPLLHSWTYTKIHESTRIFAIYDFKEIKLCLTLNTMHNTLKIDRKPSRRMIWL